MEFESNPALGAVLKEWQEDIAQRTREQEHQWLLKTVRDLQNENARIKREVGRRDRLILRHALDGKLDPSDLLPLAVIAYLVWYLRESWWETALALVAFQVCYALYLGNVVEHRRQAKHDAIFTEMEGQLAEDY